jgi:hypothetical protein
MGLGNFFQDFVTRQELRLLALDDFLRCADLCVALTAPVAATPRPLSLPLPLPLLPLPLQKDNNSGTYANNSDDRI